MFVLIPDLDQYLSFRFVTDFPSIRDLLSDALACRFLCV